MMRKLEIGVSRNMNLSGIVTIILGAMYVGAMAVVVFLILVQFQRREGMPCTFPPLFRVELGVLGLSWDFWAKSVSELQLEVEQIQLDAIGDGCSDRWRVCRWPDSTEQAVTWLMGIFILLCLRGRRWRRRNEMRFSPLARGCSSSTSRWEGTIWDKNPALPGVGCSFGAKLRRIHIQWKLYRCGEGLGLSCAVIIKEKIINTGARPDDKHLLVKYGHNHWCLFVYQGSDGRGVGQSASKGRFPQTLLDCSSVESLGRGEELYLDRRCIHESAWTTNYGEFTERGRPLRSVNVSSLLLQWDVLDGNHPPP